MNKPYFRSFCALCAIGLFLAGCERDEKIVTYSAPKDSPRTVTVADAQPSAQDQTAPAQPDQPADQQQAQPIQWALPAGWKMVPSEQAMRYATIQVSDDANLVLTVIRLPAAAEDAAGLKANVNRWEGQLGLPPSDDEGIKKVVKHQDISGVGFDSIDLTGAETQNPKLRMLAAMAMANNQNWFFKLAGPADKVAGHTKDFDSFVQSIRFTGGGETAERAPAPVPPQPNEQQALPAGHPAIGGAPAPAGEVATSIPADAGATWTAPKGWELEPAKQMRVATYKTPGDGEIIISKFPGDLGGVLMNVNRWRGQVGLEALSDEKDAKPQATTKVGGNDGQIYDFTGIGDQNVKRIRVAMVKVGEETWFFKLQGDAAAVKAQQDAFDTMLGTVKFAAGENK